MAENVVNWIITLFGGKIPSHLCVFIVSMLPVIELRGGMIAAKLLNVEFWKAFFICYIGNIVPIPFILLFIKRIIGYLKQKKHFSGFAHKLESHTVKKISKVNEKKLEWGLLLLVAIPLPGTGGWTGALVAAFLEMRIKKSFPIISAGVLIANIIMSALSYGLLGALGIGG